MTQIQVDQVLLQKLGGLASPVELCDADGKVLGHYLPEAEYQKMLYGSFQVPVDEEEIARRRAEEGGSTLQEIWQKLGRT